MMENRTLEGYLEYMTGIRRQLHRYPEVGFDLPKTVQTVTDELEAIGVAYTLEYGQGSVVAEIGRGERIIAVRADMDALPVEEKTGLPYASVYRDRMHACGHDSHTAVVLGLAKYLKSREPSLPCRIRLIFQPSEEGAVSGAGMMVDNGVTEGVEHIICTHCENMLDVGKIGVCEGDYMAACVPLTVRFKGATAHAAMAEQGIDAIAMAHEAYARLRTAVAEAAGTRKYIWSVGRFQGGEAHNVVADACQMDISFRFYDMAFADTVRQLTYGICGEIATNFGGQVEIDWHMSAGPVHNDELLVRTFRAAQGAGTVQIPPRMSSEDFSWYLTKVPGFIFRFGTRNEETGCTALAHRNDFKIDERGMQYALEAFIKYIAVQIGQ